MRKQIGDLELILSLGKGGLGEVFLTQKAGKRGFFATKKLEKSLIEKTENINRFYNEINILRARKNQNLVKLIDYKTTENNIYIVMDYCNGGNLTNCLTKYMNVNKKPFSEEIVQYLMKQIINGLSFLHSKNIIHRNLKLDNILVCFNSEKDKSSLNMLNSTVKITDYGFSKILKDSINPQTKSIIGNNFYMSPDLLASMVNNIPNSGNSNKADIWSLGVLCYEMLVGYCPFVGNNLQDLLEKIKKGYYPLPNTLSREAADFIRSMLVLDENKRFNCQELLKHDFLNKNVNEFKPLTSINIHGVIAQKGQFIIVNLLLNQTNVFLVENKKEIINLMNFKQGKKQEIEIGQKNNIYEKNQIQNTIDKKHIIPKKNNNNQQQNNIVKPYIPNPYKMASLKYHKEDSE